MEPGERVAAEYEVYCADDERVRVELVAVLRVERVLVGVEATTVIALVTYSS